MNKNLIFINKENDKCTIKINYFTNNKNNTLKLIHKVSKGDNINNNKTFLIKEDNNNH